MVPKDTKQASKRGRQPKVLSDNDIYELLSELQDSPKGSNSGTHTLAVTISSPVELKATQQEETHAWY